MFQTSSWIKCSNVIGIDYLLSKSHRLLSKWIIGIFFGLGQKFCDESVAKIDTCYTVHNSNLKIMNSELRQSIKC